jgi:hypothetical protein
MCVVLSTSLVGPAWMLRHQKEVRKKNLEYDQSGINMEVSFE